MPAERMRVALKWLDDNLRTDPRLAREITSVLLPEAEAAGDQGSAAWLRFWLGWLALDADDYEQGLAIMASVRTTFETLGDREGLSRCLNALGYANHSLGIYDLALDDYRQAADEAEKYGFPSLAGAASTNMAMCLYELEEPEEALQAIEYCRQHYEIAPRNTTNAYSTAGLVYWALGRFDEAERELRAAMAAAGGALHDELEARQILAEVYLDSGRLDEAAALVSESLDACSRASERLIGTKFRLTRARLSQMRGRCPEALPDIQAAITCAREIGSRKLEADAEKALYLAWQNLGECEHALGAFVRQARLKEALKSEQTSRRVIGLHDERARREARHFENLYRQISAIGEIGQRITANLDLDVTLENLHGAINGLMDAPTLMIALVDEEQRCLDYRLVIVRGRREAPFSFPLGKDAFGCWCVNHRSAILIGDLEAEYKQYVRSYEDLLYDGIAEKSLIFVPLLVGDKVVGMMSVQSHIVHAYDKQKVETVRAIGAYIAIAIENSKLFRQIQRLASIDGLTGLLNRRHLTEAIQRAHLQTRRYKRPTGIIMIDVDHFKQVNDSYGHDAGDEVLKALAKVFTEKLRKSDAIGRFGGEEFVALLPETPLEGTGVLAERLREAIEALRMPLPCGGSFQVTASFGVSVIHPDDPDPDTVLRRVDQALYHAKQSGRNRVSTAADDLT
ncbi:MAG TPA: diguanylate cyclase [Holophaga sp.]|nr:diguanylate cyclase [Holophaga sp.]